MHVRRSCFSLKTDCFLTLLLSSSLLKVSNLKSTDSVNMFSITVKGLNPGVISVIFSIRSDFVKLLLSNQDPDL